MPKYSIIIPVCGQEELTVACLNSIRDHSKNYEVIVVDNGSPVGMYSGDCVIRNETNLGFPKAINQGIAKARGEVIILLNNDTVVSPHWLERLDEHLKTYDIVGPVTNRISGVQQVATAQFSLPEGLEEVSEAIYKDNAGRSMPLWRLVFFCVAIKRAVIDKIGVLDEQFSPGNCEDDDFCLRAIEAGFKLGVATDCFIYHKGGATHTSLDIKYRELLETNTNKLLAKWPSGRILELQNIHKARCLDILPVPKRSLALVMVVRNEELGLERAIASARPFVDEVIVAVDNSSTDKTLEIAERLADVVKRFDWRDDFAWARNFAQEGVKTDWILFLDGHEYVEKSDGIEGMLNLPSDGLLCTVELESGSQIRNPRIYRNGLVFSGAVHEIQNCKSLTVFSDFVVKHARLGGQADGAIALRDKQRNDQLSRIMGKQLSDDPSNTRASFHLALHEQSLGQFRRAIKYQKLYFKHAKFSGERWYVYFNQALCRFSLGHKLRALWALDNAEKETPGRWEVAKLRGLIHYNDGNFKKAIKFFVDSFDNNIGDESYKPWKRNPVEIWNLIGQSYFNLGMHDFAGDAFRQACALCKDPKQKKFLFDRSVLMSKMAQYH